MPPALFFSLRTALLIWSLLWFHTKFRIKFYSCVNNVFAVLIKIELNLEIVFGSMDILTILIF